MTDLKSKFAAVTSKTYSEQAKFFMNAFWTYGIEQEAENIWKFAQKCIELDTEKKKNGNELDEFKAHKFLEEIGETKTVVELRETLRKIDIDMNKRMALVEYLIFKFNKKLEDLISLPQGDPKQIEEAQAKLQAVNDALQDLQVQLDAQQRDLEAQREAEAAAKQSEAAAKQAEVAAKQAEAVVKQAEAELKAAVEDLYKQEQDYQNLVKSLEAKARDENEKLVARRTAEAKLAQVKQEDPLPLRKAKITQEAALRKVEKERKRAEEERKKAEAATKFAELEAAKAAEATLALEEQKKRVEEAINETEKKLQEATEYLEHVKKSSVPRGALWWIERELKDAQRFLPKKKQTL